MKKIITMNNKAMNLILSLLMFAFLACDNPIEMPVKAGLGPVEDIRDPTVSLESPNPSKVPPRMITN